MYCVRRRKVSAERSRDCQCSEPTAVLFISTTGLVNEERLCWAHGKEASCSTMCVSLSWAVTWLQVHWAMWPRTVASLFLPLVFLLQTVASEKREYCSSTTYDFNIFVVLLLLFQILNCVCSLFVIHWCTVAIKNDSSLNK